MRIFLIKLYEICYNYFFTGPGIDYTPIVAEDFPLNQFIKGTSVRRDCFSLFIKDDLILENDEYLFLDLSLDTVFGIQEGTRIILNSTRVTILVRFIYMGY